MLFELLSVLDWLTPARAIFHLIKRLPDDGWHVLRGETLSEHTLFVANESYALAKDILTDMGISQISVDVNFPGARERSILVPTRELQSISEAFYRAGINYRS